MNFSLFSQFGMIFVKPVVRLLEVARASRAASMSLCTCQDKLEEGRKQIENDMLLARNGLVVEPDEHSRSS